MRLFGVSTPPFLTDFYTFCRLDPRRVGCLSRKEVSVSNIPETELIEYVKKQLKEKGFKKKNKRWTKVVEDFTISFLIQGSCYDKQS